MRRTPTFAALLTGTLCMVLGTLSAQLRADDPAPPAQSEHERESSESAAASKLTIQLDLDRAVYSKTRYKNPPQFAVWIENRATKEFRTLYVTQKLGRGTWNGKPTVPVSLPHWVNRHNKRTGTKGDPTLEQPLADAITQPTPTEQLKVSSSVAVGTKWECYVEVNVSGDFNDAFPASQADGTKDAYGNGQPSLVYCAVIDVQPAARTSFKLLGRTGQWKPSAKIDADLEGITTAKKLFSRMQVSVGAQ